MRDLSAECDALLIARQQREEGERELLADSVPEEFQCAILSDLMKDPVRLPSSGAVVDRSTISRHLLSDQFDPFNRQPLTMDMLIPMPELKARIHAFLTEARQQRKLRQQQQQMKQEDSENQ